ncbi:sperm-associated antigen 17-like isoform X2 [Ischnura elegans]|uniref:sperm-associated antigen 17-like isoform X2 n=1 Tax=Ischnura elegans TaxID=197161 RepID=UPI001ED8856B|nr:sperm-associated antigen 17-like isoform X2 [Ischnura elegans]
MSSKKKKGKDKSKSNKKGEPEESAKSENPNWEQELYDFVFEENTCVASFLVESESRQMEARKQLIEVLSSGIRRPVKLILKTEMLRIISQASRFKTNPNRPKFYQVCEKAEQELEEKGSISPYLWSLVLKFQLLDLYEKYTAQKIKEEIYRAEEARKERELPKIWSPCADDKSVAKGGESPRKGGKSGKSAKSNTSTKGGRGKSPEKGAKSSKKSIGKTPEKKKGEAGGGMAPPAIFDKPDSKIRVKGEEWKDIPYLDDSPVYGPGLYVFILGFYDYQLPLELVKSGIPLLCFVKIVSLTPQEEYDPGFSKESIETKNSKTKEISSTEKIQEKRAALEKITKNKDLETQKELNNFWNGLMEDEKALSNFENVPIIPYDLPEIPSDPEQLEDYKKKIYDQLSNALYDVVALKKLHAIFEQKMKVWFTDTKDTAADVDQSHYDGLMNEIPPEGITVPIIMDCMLQQVTRTNEGSEEVLEDETAEVDEEEDILRIMEDKLTDLNIEYGITSVVDEDITYEDPQVIAYKDYLLKRTYRYKGTLDLAAMTKDVLRTIPVFNLWEKISPQKELEKIVYAQSIKRLVEVINDDCMDYNVVSSILYLLKFEEMLEHMIEEREYKTETSSFNTYVLPGSKIIGRYGTHLLTRRQADSITSVTREYGDRIFLPNDNENGLEQQEDKQLAIFPLLPAYTPCPSQEGGNQLENSHAKPIQEVKVVVKKGCIEVLKHDSSNKTRNFYDSRHTSHLDSETEREMDAPFYSRQIPKLSDLEDGKKLFGETGCLGFLEELSEKVLLQAIYECLCEQKNIECSYFPPSDALLVMFYKEEGLTEVYWNEKLPTAVCFREFYDNILQEEIKWLVEQERIFHESIKQALLESSDQAAKEEEEVPSPPCDAITLKLQELDPCRLIRKEEYLLQGTLKHQNLVPSNMEKESPKAHEKDKKEKKGSKKSITKSMKSVKQQETEPESLPEVKTPAVEATPPIPSQSEVNLKKGIAKEKTSLSTKSSFMKKEQGGMEESKEEEDIKLSDEEKEESIIPQAYDLGPNGGRFSGKSVQYVSPDGDTIISVDKRQMPTGEQVFTLKIQLGTDYLYHSWMLPSKAQGKGAPKDNVEGSNGVLLGSGQPLDEVTSFHIISEATGAVVAFCNQRTNPAPKMVDSRKESTEKEEKAKVASGKYGERFDENFRLYLQNGNILKFMKNGSVTILHPSGRICNQNFRRQEAGDGPDQETIFLEPTGRRYRGAPGGGISQDLPPQWVRQATDLEANEMFWCREDGVQSLLKADGSLTVIFPDGTRICSKLKEEEETDDFIFVSLDFILEHPLYARVTLEGGSALLTVGHENIRLGVSPDGIYKMTTGEQVNFIVNTSFVEMSKGHSQSTLSFNTAAQVMSKYDAEGGEQSNGKEKDLCTTDDGWGNVFTVSIDGHTTLSRTEDIREGGEGEVPMRKRFLVLKRNGSGSEFVPNRVIWDILQQSKHQKDVSVTHYPCEHCNDQNCPQPSHFLVMFHPVSNKERYFLESDMKCSITRTMDNTNLTRTTHWYPKVEGSTKKQEPRWFFPLPKADFEESGYPKTEEKAPPAFACKYCHPEPHKESRHWPLPDAFSLLVLRSLGSLSREGGDILMTDKLISAYLQLQEMSKEEKKLSHTSSEEIKEPRSTEVDEEVEDESIELEENETETSFTSWLGFLNENAWANGASEMYFTGLEVEASATVDSTESAEAEDSNAMSL